MSSGWWLDPRMSRKAPDGGQSRAEDGTDGWSGRNCSAPSSGRSTNWATTQNNDMDSSRSSRFIQMLPYPYSDRPGGAPDVGTTALWWWLFRDSVGRPSFSRHSRSSRPLLLLKLICPAAASRERCICSRCLLSACRVCMYVCCVYLRKPTASQQYKYTWCVVWMTEFDRVNKNWRTWWMAIVASNYCWCLFVSLWIFQSNAACFDCKFILYKKLYVHLVS